MKKKPGISQRVGKRKDDEAAETQRALDGMHQEIERLKAANEQLKADQAASVRMYPGFQYRMYPRSKYGE
jgi:hypothetical protein